MKKVLGMGNALTDILLQIDNDEILDQLALPKGSMQLVDAQKSAAISSVLAHIVPTMAAGGSASNTINGIARLGVSTGFIGKVGNDAIGSFFKNDMIANGVTPQLELSESASGTCTVLVSADGERTLCTYLGAACEIEAADLRPEMFRGYDIFHIEGYLVQNHDLIRTAVKMAKEFGLVVSLDLASYNVVEANLHFLHEIISSYVDIVFANEEEARAFTGKEPEEALIHLSAHCDIAIVKIGKEGSYIKTKQEHHIISPVEAACIDTTGAGDLYAAGFLYGLAKGYRLELCGKIGSLVSGKVVEVLGAKMANQTWNALVSEIKLL
ncbi:MAG: adenosine kinase [Porphyromonadaceae bacterium CG2_30_38_12]|nr:MAG: adenosine kinase [Porphyromonadaceae bacterium CG2_30_38_12]